MSLSLEDALPDISVVVCCYNGVATLGACLDAINRQTFRDHAELIVVDDGSTDGTAELAARYGATVVRHDHNRGVSAAHNTGIRASRAPIIAFTDDDCIPAVDWLAELLVPYERPDVIGVGGTVSVARVETFVQRYLSAHNPLAPLELELDSGNGLAFHFWLYIRRMWQSDRPAVARPVFGYAGANMSFRRHALERVGPYDERFHFGSEDEWICSRIRKHFSDRLLWFEPRAVVHHDFDGTLRDLLRRSFAYGRGHAQAYLLESDRRWPIIFPAPLVVLLLLLPGRRLRLAGLLLVPLLLPQGIVSAQRSHRPGELVFSYLRLLEESAHNAGLASFLFRSRWGGRARVDGV